MLAACVSLRYGTGSMQLTVESWLHASAYFFPLVRTFSNSRSSGTAWRSNFSAPRQENRLLRSTLAGRAITARASRDPRCRFLLSRPSGANASSPLLRLLQAARNRTRWHPQKAPEPLSLEPVPMHNLGAEGGGRGLLKPRARSSPEGFEAHSPSAASRRTKPKPGRQPSKPRL